MPRISPGSVRAATVSVLSGFSSASSASVMARPKSRIFRRPSSVMKMLSGLRSRCTTPRAWAAARPAAICSPRRCVCLWQRAAFQACPERLAVEQLGDQVRHVAGADVEDRQQVGMRQRRDRARLLGEPGQPVGIVGGAARQDLDRHVAAEPRIASAIDLAHAARADRRDDLVGAESGTGREGHGRGSQAIADPNPTSWCPPRHRSRQIAATVGSCQAWARLARPHEPRPGVEMFHDLAAVGRHESSPSTLPDDVEREHGVDKSCHSR